jgi:hypothetical protein
MDGEELFIPIAKRETREDDTSTDERTAGVDGVQGFQRARIDEGGLGVGSNQGRVIDDDVIDAPSGKPTGKAQPRRARAHDEHVRPSGKVTAPRLIGRHESSFREQRGNMRVCARAKRRLTEK